LLVHGRWTFPGIPASSTTKTGYDIAQILLKVALNTINQSNKSGTVDRGFEFRSFQSKHYAIGICCFSSKHWLDRNQGNESECGVLVVEEAGMPGKVHRPWTSNWYTLSLAAGSRAHPFCNIQAGREPTPY
jgi:hypothetical protein